ncbi:hypothetical protein, partial [Bradyrhizobium sp. Mp64]|uniref:hypothetical protein n=1 Tax=Bradyrhizobium sp. Mp64 TaxID=3042158 RepID=UPI00248C0E24
PRKLDRFNGAVGFGKSLRYTGLATLPGLWHRGGSRSLSGFKPFRWQTQRVTATSEILTVFVQFRRDDFLWSLLPYQMPEDLILLARPAV